MPSTRSILLVEEDAVCRGFLADNLTADGYDVIVAADKADAIAKLTLAPDLVLCDVNGHTLDLLDAVRGADGLAARIDPTTPLIVLTRQADALMRVRLFEHGSDDVVRKPFHYGELLARIRAVTRRGQAAAEGGSTIAIGDHTVDLGTRSITRDGADVRLSPTEWRLLEYLLRHPGKLLSQRALLHDVWGPQYLTETNYLRQYMARLRRKLETDPTHPRHLLTEPGMGYRFRP